MQTPDTKDAAFARLDAIYDQWCSLRDEEPQDRSPRAMFREHRLRELEREDGLLRAVLDILPRKKDPAP